MSALTAPLAATRHQRGRAPGEAVTTAISPGPASSHPAPSRAKPPAGRGPAPSGATGRDRQARVVRRGSEHGADHGSGQLAVEIRRIRQRLDSPGALSHPQVLAELTELYKQVSAGLDQREGRHRRAAADQVALRRPVVLHAAAGRSAADPPVPDATGLDLKPNPLLAATSDDLLRALRRYRQWSGDPSYRAMATAARHQVAHSTLFVALNGARLPSLKVVLAIVAGCGGGADDQRAFASAWRLVRSGDLAGAAEGGTCAPDPVRRIG